MGRPAFALPDYPGLAAALHPLVAPPQGPGWNLAELHDLVPDGAVSVQAAVLVGLVPREAGTQVLLTRRTDALRQHAGQVSFPGGRVELDDADAVATAMRETHEEIGVAALERTTNLVEAATQPVQAVQQRFPILTGQCRSTNRGLTGPGA